MNSNPDELPATEMPGADAIAGNVVGWIVFLFGEYSIVAMAVFPVCCEWHYPQLAYLLPAILVAYWAFKPDPKWAKQRLRNRLIVGGLALIGAGFLGVAAEEISYRFRHPSS